MAERGEGLLGVVAAAVEAPVDERLDAPTGGAEERGDGEGRAGDGEIVAAGEAAEGGLEREDDPEVETREERGDGAVDDSAIDDPVDLVEAIAQHSYPRREHNDRQCDRHGEAPDVVTHEGVEEKACEEGDRDADGARREPLHLEPLETVRAPEPKNDRGRDERQTDEDEDESDSRDDSEDVPGVSTANGFGMS